MAKIYLISKKQNNKANKNNKLLILKENISTFTCVSSFLLSFHWPNQKSENYFIQNEQNYKECVRCGT